MLPCKITVDNVLDDYVKMKLAKSNQSKYVNVSYLQDIFCCPFFVWSKTVRPSPRGARLILSVTDPCHDCMFRGAGCRGFGLSVGRTENLGSSNMRRKGPESPCLIGQVEGTGLKQKLTPQLHKQFAVKHLDVSLEIQHPDSLMIQIVADYMNKCASKQ